MRLIRMGTPAIAGALSLIVGAAANAALVSDWAVTFGTANVTGANTSTPSFDNAGGMDVVGGFPTISLDPGDFIQVTATMSVTGGDTSYGNQLRMGLFREIGSGPNTGDGTGYSGISAAYLDNLREHIDPARARIFSSGGAGAPVVIGSAGTDPEADTINSANFTANFTMTITRDGANLDISGSIVSAAHNFTQSFSVDDYAPTTAVLDKYDFNRVGFLVGSVGGSQLDFSNVIVTTNVPEPAASTIALGALCAGAVVRRRKR
jgi:hypothetical protein